MPTSLQIIEELAKDFKTIAKSEGKWFSKLDNIIKLIVLQVERVKESAKGKEKKAVALELIMDVWDKYLNLKNIPDVFERPVIKFFAGKLIDAAVAFFNKNGTFRHA